MLLMLRISDLGEIVGEKIRELVKRKAVGSYTSGHCYLLSQSCIVAEWASLVY